MEIYISKKANELLDDYSKGTGYGTKGMVIQELIFSMSELIDAEKRAQETKLAGIVGTFTRFEERKSTY